MLLGFGHPPLVSDCASVGRHRLQDGRLTHAEGEVHALEAGGLITDVSWAGRCTERSGDGAESFDGIGPADCGAGNPDVAKVGLLSGSRYRDWRCSELAERGDTARRPRRARRFGRRSCDEDRRCGRIEFARTDAHARRHFRAYDSERLWREYLLLRRFAGERDRGRLQSHGQTVPA
jgi:hypothetical protein